jgi:hypothetical protein
MGESFHVCLECEEGTSDYRGKYCEACGGYLCGSCAHYHWEKKTKRQRKTICKSTPRCVDCGEAEGAEDYFSTCTSCKLHVCDDCEDEHSDECAGPPKTPIAESDLLKWALRRIGMTRDQAEDAYRKEAEATAQTPPLPVKAAAEAAASATSSPSKKRAATEDEQHDCEQPKKKPKADAE